MAKRIKYQDTEFNQYKLQKLGELYGQLVGLTQTCIKALAATNQADTEYWSYPQYCSDESAKQVTERKRRAAVKDCAKATESACFRELSHSFSYLYKLMYEMAEVEESEFENPNQWWIFKNNFVACFNRLRTLFWLAQYRVKPHKSAWPHRSQLGGKDLEGCYETAKAWILALPKWPAKTPYNKSEMVVYHFLLAKISLGNRRSILMLQDMGRDERKWLRELLSPLGWTLAKKTAWMHDYDHDYLEIFMPKISGIE